MTSFPHTKTTNLTDRYIYGRYVAEYQPRICWPGSGARAVTTSTLLSYIYTRKLFSTCKRWRWGPPVNEKRIYPFAWFLFSARLNEKTEKKENAYKVSLKVVHLFRKKVVNFIHNQLNLELKFTLRWLVPARFYCFVIDPPWSNILNQIFTHVLFCVNVKPSTSWVIHLQSI